ncbi:multiubiquitin domain-containing protein (plasmid) [Rhizobium sp. 32-5/1]|uniref:multiubiquitin domain-containing protein n=1 Tax=Rhizobium sp. 32-5/1 TaxID=3019602 RepID=UPI00240D6F00|nr:multiubiquitin domain-containing protein [Rhizobium sp. 32-5/1]WEZ86296.1 multiubiquitin domain-containing protein [Rhizobium sp. 32-5/1]
MAQGHNKFEFTVNGALHGTGDRIIDGNQIREIAGLLPASSFVLIQIVEATGRSIGLEDEVKFDSKEKAVFLSWPGDRIYTFTVDERGWEWGSGTISAADVYRYAGIDEDLELILDSSHDAIIPAEGEVTLSEDGVERIRSREAKTVTIKVNGRPRTVPKQKHSYREIALLAYPDANFENFKYTITYLKGVHGAEGDLVEGEKIEVKNGMVFNVRRSDKS